MKILYDHQIFEGQKVGGVSRYFCELMERLKNGKGLEVALSLKYSENEYLKRSSFAKRLEKNLNPHQDFLKRIEFKGKRSINRLANQFLGRTDAVGINKRRSIEALKKQDFDIFHPTYYDDYFLPYLGNKPFVLTIYDMIHERFPEQFGRFDWTSQKKRKLAQKASCIIAISETTKKDIVEFFAIQPEKIQVVHLANSVTAASADGEAPMGLPERYVLFVGARTLYKNFRFFVEAVSPLMEKDLALNIVCAGAPFTQVEINSLSALGISERVHCYSVSDADLYVLYRKAMAFVFPSLYEGFGLPVLEAFANDCPTLLSNAGSLSEVGGDAALYFDPRNAESLRTALAEVLGGSEVRARLIELGVERLKWFSWDKTVKETEVVYRGLCE